MEVIKCVNGGLRTMASANFSKDGKYYAQITLDGKLKIWETKDGKLLQEYTPDFHLTSPCTCLHFVEENFIVNKVTMWFFVQNFTFQTI